MSVWQDLHGRDGELLCVSITVEAQLLEQLLDTLSEAPFPINPEIHHHATLVRDEERVPAVKLEFPAWGGHLSRLEDILATRGFHSGLEVHPMIEEIRMS